MVTFEQRVAEGTAQALERADELYRGDLLQGFTLNEPLFQEWLVAERSGYGRWRWRSGPGSCPADQG